MIITYESKSGICPHINEKITVLGKYEIVEDKFERYIHHICPIAKNFKKIIEIRR